MPNPQFIEEKSLCLVDIKETLADIEKRDNQLNYLSNKVKEYLELFVTLSPKKKEELHKKLIELNLTRLREDHIVKLLDFLPLTVNDLKIVLQAYPLSMPKKDQESIVQVIQEVVK